MRQHGTSACYAWGPEPGCVPGRGCRCSACSLARSEADRQRRAKAEPPYVSATPVREHVEFLSEQGMGWKQVARAAGLSPSVVWKLMYGPPERGPAKRCRPTTAAKILAVTPAGAAAGSLVDAAPTWEAIGRLLSRGWTKRAIALGIGQTGPGLQVSRARVQRGTAARIKALLDEPVPDTVGRAWSEHHKATSTVEEPDPEPRDDIDVLYLEFAQVLEARMDQDWRQHRACRSTPPWLFFPARGDHDTLSRAKAVCASCPVAEDCLQAHLNERDGVYGGLSGKERRALRQERAA